MSFTGDMDAFKAEFERRANLVAAEVVREAGKMILTHTHVLSGKLIANWNYSAEHPDNRVTEKTADHATAKINNIEDIPPEATKHVHYIANGVHYAGYAELGTSKMPAHLMLGLTVQAFPSIVDRVAKRVAG